MTKQNSLESLKAGDSPKKDNSSPRLYKHSTARKMAKELQEIEKKKLIKENKAIQKAIKAGTLPKDYVDSLGLIGLKAPGSGAALATEPDAKAK